MAGLADAVGRPSRGEGAEAGDDVLQAGPVHVVHDQEVQPAVLVDVVGLDEVGMVQNAGRPRLAVKASQRRRVACLAGGQHLDGNPPADLHVLAQVHRAHAARAEAFENLVLADGEAAPLALEELLGLELRHQTGRDQQADQLLARVARRCRLRRLPDKSVQALGQDQLALADQVEKFVRW